LVDVRRPLAGVLGRKIGPHRVLLTGDHHLHRVLLGTHGVPPEPAAPASAALPPLFPPAPTPACRPCSSRHVSRLRRSCTRASAASPPCRMARVSASSPPARALT